MMQSVFGSAIHMLGRVPHEVAVSACGSRAEAASAWQARIIHAIISGVE